MRKLIKWAVIGLIALILFASCVAVVSGAGDPEPAEKGGDLSGSEDAWADALGGDVKQKPRRELVGPDEAAPQFTSGQENAVAAAESYLDLMGFSQSGLVEQLEYEGYTTADARFAVSQVDANWRQEAVESAESYLDTMPFSEPGLIDQLEFDGFTPSQARYGARVAG